MEKIRSFLCSGADIDFKTVSPDDVVTCCIPSDKFSITKFNEGCTIVKIDPVHEARINAFVGAFQPDLFSEAAIGDLGGTFRLNSRDNPVEYIYYLDHPKLLRRPNGAEQAVQLDWTAIQSLQPNRFTKYPFRLPSARLLYFGLYADGELACLVSGYLNEGDAIELTGETLPEYRNRGYAKATTAAIADTFLSRGCEVFTTNGIHHSVSIKTVESLGFKQMARRLVFYPSRS